MKRQRVRSRWLIVVGVVVVGMVASLFVPWSAWSLSSHPNPIDGYDETAQRISILQAERASEMNPDCVAKFMTHGQKVQHAIVMIHGYTSCPAQFQQLGQRYYDLGYNVLIAPLPHHGLADRLTDEQSQLTADELGPNPLQMGAPPTGRG